MDFSSSAHYQMGQSISDLIIYMIPMISISPWRQEYLFTCRLIVAHALLRHRGQPQLAPWVHPPRPQRQQQHRLAAPTGPPTAVIYDTDHCMFFGLSYGFFRLRYGFFGLRYGFFGLRYGFFGLTLKNPVASGGPQGRAGWPPHLCVVFFGLR